MMRFEEQQGLKTIEQAAKEIEKVTLFLRELSHLIGFEVDEELLVDEAACLAGYLSECHKTGNPPGIVEAIKEYFGEILKAEHKRSRIGGIISLN